MSGAGEAKSLLAKLRSDLQDKKLSDTELQSLLEQLKVLGRSPANAVPIFANDGVETLVKYGFDRPADGVSREAMRCLANAMLLNEQVRQTCLNLNYEGKAADRMKNDDRDDEFLATRILFFTTYTGKLDIETLIQKHDLANTISTNLKRHAQRFATDPKGATPHPAHPITEMALQESLKMIPNLIYHHPACAANFESTIAPLVAILSHHPLPTPPLQPPISLAINALMNLELNPTAQIEDSSIRDGLFPTNTPTTLTDRLVQILDKATTAYPESDLDKTLTPLLTLFRKLYPAAPIPVQESLQLQLLPSATSRSQPLGVDDTLPSRLLRLTLSALAPQTRSILASLLYDLSSSDPETLVANIGYGYASGFLASNGIEMPASAIATHTATQEGRVDINPITGQRVDKESVDELPEMTEEEKEREAERLFVLFERLRATGVVDVENPVTKAMREGQFED